MASITQRLAYARRNAEVRAHQAALRPLLATHSSITDTLRTLPPTTRRIANISVSDYNDVVYISICLRELHNLRSDPRLTRVLAALAGDEWRASSQDYTYDTPNRDFRFERRVALGEGFIPANNIHAKWLDRNGHAIPSHFTLSVAVYAYVKADSPTCRIVVKEIKEEVVRTEVKEIVCA